MLYLQRDWTQQSVVAFIDWIIFSNIVGTFSQEPSSENKLNFFRTIIANLNPLQPRKHRAHICIELFCIRWTIYSLKLLLMVLRSILHSLDIWWDEGRKLATLNKSWRSNKSKISLVKICRVRLSFITNTVDQPLLNSYSTVWV